MKPVKKRCSGGSSKHHAKTLNLTDVVDSPGSGLDSAACVDHPSLLRNQFQERSAAESKTGSKQHEKHELDVKPKTLGLDARSLLGRDRRNAQPATACRTPETGPSISIGQTAPEGLDEHREPHRVRLSPDHRKKHISVREFEITERPRPIQQDPHLLGGGRYLAT